MIAEICVGFGLILVLILIVYLLFFHRSFTYKKKKYKDTTSITVHAKKNLAKVSVKAGDITFERKRIRKGQSVEFDFPNSANSAKLIVEGESGHVQTVDV